MGSKVYITKNLLTEEECFDIILKYRNKPEYSRIVTILGTTYDDKQRISKTFMWKNDSNLEKKFNKSPITFQFTEYTQGGYFRWHTDNQFNRLETNIVNLNDDYAGGGIEIRDFGIYNLDIGDCLSFDSTLEHQALPIISGIRYSLVAWLINK